MQARILYSLLLFLAAARPTIGQSGDGLPAFKQAVACYQQARYFDAEELFKQAYARNPENGQAAHGVAMCLVNTRRHQASLEWFEKAEAAPKAEAQYFNNHASALEEIGRPEEAAKLFAECLKRDARFVPAHFGLGRISARLGRVEQARASLEKARALDPKHVDAAYELADLEFRAARLDVAEPIARRIIAVRPTHAAAKFLLARICLKTDRKNEGQQLLNEARRLQAEEDAKALKRKAAGSFLELAAKSLRENKLPEGTGYLMKALEADPESREARGGLAEVEARLRAAGRVAEADAVKAALDKAR